MPQRHFPAFDLGAALRLGPGGAGWTPMQTPGLRAWYRSDLGITLVGADVDAWADQSGNGNHFVAPAAGNRPLYVASGGPGDVPYAEFDGIGEFIRRGPFGWGGNATECGVIMFARAVTTISGDRWLSYNLTEVFYQDSAGNILRVGHVAQSLSTSQTTSDRMWTYRWDGANQQLMRGTTQEDTDANVAAAIVDGAQMALGASSNGAVFSNIRVYELVIARTYISSATLALAAAYGSGRYGAGIL